MADEKLSEELESWGERDTVTVDGDAWAEVVEAVAALETRAEKAERERDELQERKNEREEADAACCPEDVGPHEWIRYLTKQLNETQEQCVELLDTIEQWQDASDLCSPPEDEFGDPCGVTPQMAREYWEQVETERDAALARIRELEADVEELAAFRCLVDWMRMGRTRRISTDNGVLVARCTELRNFDGWNLEPTAITVAKAPNPIALATALDPNWRKEG